MWWHLGGDCDLTQVSQPSGKNHCPFSGRGKGQGTSGCETGHQQIGKISCMSQPAKISSDSKKLGGPLPDNHHRGGDQLSERSSSWELVEEEVELAVSTGPVPYHLLEGARLLASGAWTPRQRIERAFDFGKTDAAAALFSYPQAPSGSFPLRSQYYIILYDPQGNWPRYTRNLQSYYRDVKIYKKGEVPGRLHAFRELVVSRGFASLPEAQAYVEGAQCRWPKEPFGN